MRYSCHRRSAKRHCFLAGDNRLDGTCCACEVVSAMRNTSFFHNIYGTIHLNVYEAYSAFAIFRKHKICFLCLFPMALL